MWSNSQANRSVIPSRKRFVILRRNKSVILRRNKSVILSEGERAFCVPRSRRTPQLPAHPMLSVPFSPSPPGSGWLHLEATM